MIITIWPINDETKLIIIRTLINIEHYVPQRKKHRALPSSPLTLPEHRRLWPGANAGLLIHMKHIYSCHFNNPESRYNFLSIKIINTFKIKTSKDFDIQDSIFSPFQQFQKQENKLFQRKDNINTLIETLEEPTFQYSIYFFCLHAL